MCLLIAMFGMIPDAPLIVAANRDERLDRPAVPVTVLRDSPRILGGRDALAGGTWLAVNEHGVVAGLTNQPSFTGRDPAKRSRGELPLAFASRASAAGAVQAVAATLDPSGYNPCWMLVGDTEALFFIGIGKSGRPQVEELSHGLYVLENAPLRPSSEKAAFVADLVTGALSAGPGAGSAGAGSAGAGSASARFAGAGSAGAADAVAALESVLRDHRPAISEFRTDPAGVVRPPALSAACVHAVGYGTRSAMTVSVPVSGLPSVRVAGGRPCEHDLRDVTSLWAAQEADAVRAGS